MRARRNHAGISDHLLPKGFKGIQDEAQALLDAVGLTVPANYEKRDFWQAAVIVNKGSSSAAGTPKPPPKPSPHGRVAQSA